MFDGLRPPGIASFILGLDPDNLPPVSRKAPMATAPATAPRSAAPPLEHKREIIVISHSFLFYWWPVWAFGFLLAAITWFDGERMITVPPGSIAERQRVVEGHEGKHDVIIIPSDKKIVSDSRHTNE